MLLCSSLDTSVSLLWFITIICCSNQIEVNSQITRHHSGSPRQNENIPSHLEARWGQKVKLRCPSAGRAASVEWFKRLNESYDSWINGSELVHIHKNSLTFENISYEDAGHYLCRPSNHLGDVLKYFIVKVIERVAHRPLFRDGYPSNETAYVGASARFECRFVGDSDPRLVWLRHFVVNGSYSEPDSEVPYVEPLEITGDPHVLVIENVTFEHAGYYTCLAGNSIGVAYRSAYLTVLPVPEERIEKLEVLEQSSLVLICVAFLIFVPLSALIAVMVCRCKYVANKDKMEPRGNLVVSKKIVLEKRDVKDRDDGLLSVPFVKIDYNLVPASDSVMEAEYELPVDPAYEFPREQLVLGSILGEGAFGKVIQAEAFGLKGCKGSMTVAVKMLKENHMDSEMTVLVSEMELMKITGKHVNIVAMLGCCTQKGPLYVIVEFCANGNLRDYLRVRRLSSLLGYEVPIGAKSCQQYLSFKQLASFAYGVARGMEYLTLKKLVHRDLAARNVLLTETNVVKIADFGLARDINDSEYYKKASAFGKLPIKWMAPETLNEQVYTSESDVWSYGIVLWEIFSFGETPYPGVKHEKLYEYLKMGHRMDRPELCPMELYLLMRHCWMSSPKDRLSFEEIVKTLDGVLLNALERVYVDLNFPPILSTPENSSSSCEDC